MNALLLAILLCDPTAIEFAWAQATADVPAEVSIVAPKVEPQKTPETRQVWKQTGTQTVKQCHRGRPCTYVEVPVYGYVTEQVPVDAASEYATPLDSCERILEYLRPQSRKTLLDLGSGDGRMVVEWARWLGYPAIGIESDPQRVAQARAFAASRGVSHLVTIIEGDFTKIDWPVADVIFVYQFPDVMAEVSDRIKAADRVVSFSHQVPGLAMQSHNGGEFYSWTRPKPGVQKPVAYWDGRAYTAPVCNKRGCTMCAAIRAQLQSSATAVR
jgi:SAM-dependent methyltransferase